MHSLPTCATIDMTISGQPWFPTCLIAHKAENVSIEATTENFKMLYEIVNEELATLSTMQPMPKRTVRRRKSDEFAPNGSPKHRKYHVKGNGWMERTQPDAMTPDSASSVGWGDRRKFRRVDDPVSDEMTTPTNRKTRKLRRCTNAARYLSHDDGESSHDDTFATDE